ncbi:hypothetical protein EDC14_100977 [Hydrogenispora ethanolica]|uniref:Uncharacterized protein n=1 Tax=Hydrogenispora ethanolica TaxID=1082276 RepID=A0A4R1RX57_HYDET|nr:hypothetical protein EDC14_100977 [Hydrogenispora ethanolica]
MLPMGAVSGLTWLNAKYLDPMLHQQIGCNKVFQNYANHDYSLFTWQV